jgi:hypothetical protein
VCKRGDHCRIVNAVLLGWQSDINSLFGAKHDQFSAKMPVSCNATTDKERGRAVILCRKSLACPTKDIDDLVHCGCLETRAEIGDALLRKGKRGLRSVRLNARRRPGILILTHIQALFAGRCHRCLPRERCVR